MHSGIEIRQPKLSNLKSAMSCGYPITEAIIADHNHQASEGGENRS
jgi:hypothetical protein